MCNMQQKYSGPLPLVEERILPPRPSTRPLVDTSKRMQFVLAPGFPQARDRKHRQLSNFGPRRGTA